MLSLQQYFYQSTNVIINWTGSTGTYPVLQSYVTNVISPDNSYVSAFTLSTNIWQHVAFVFDMTNGCNIFLNGAYSIASPPYKLNKTTASINNIMRKNNFLGRSNWHLPSSGNPDTNADFNNLKIFKTALSQSQVQFEMDNNIFL